MTKSKTQSADAKPAKTFGGLQRAETALGLVLVVWLLPYLILANTTLPFAEDFFFGGQAQQLGLLNASWLLYTTWSGRWLWNIIVGGYLSVIDVWVALRWGVWASMLALYGALVVFFGAVAPRATWLKQALLALAGFCLLLRALTEFGLGESLYWFLAITLYFGGAALMLITTAMLVKIRLQPSMPALVIACISSVLTSGFSENAIAVQLGIALLFAVDAKRRGACLRPFVWVFIFCILGTALSLGAPGNWARHDTTNPNTWVDYLNLPFSTLRTILYTATSLGGSLAQLLLGLWVLGESARASLPKPSPTKAPAWYWSVLAWMALIGMAAFPSKFAVGGVASRVMIVLLVAGFSVGLLLLREHWRQLGPWWQQQRHWLGWGVFAFALLALGSQQYRHLRYEVRDLPKFKQALARRHTYLSNLQYRLAALQNCIAPSRSVRSIDHTLQALSLGQNMQFSLGDNHRIKAVVVAIPRLLDPIDSLIALPLKKDHTHWANGYLGGYWGLNLRALTIGETPLNLSVQRALQGRGSLPNLPLKKRHGEPLPWPPCVWFNAE